jgi:hypothetical protein
MASLPRIAGQFPVGRAVVTLLPGPDRKRAARPYQYRLRYRQDGAEATGCVMLWDVTGGRTTYQLALERGADGGLRLHCTCADAVYRADDEGRFCKHARGLLQLGEPAYPPPRCRDSA